MSLGSKLPNVGVSIFTTMSRLAEEQGALNLGQGFPDFDPPHTLRQAMAEAIEAGKNQYAPTAGLPSLRERVSLTLQANYGHRPDPEQEVTITTGATEALFCVIAALVSPGEEVIVLDPCYDAYEPSVRLQGGVCVHVPLLEPRFSIDFDRVRDALSPRTRLLILNFPNNPTGAVLSPEDLDTLAELIRDTNVFVLSDEVYEHIVFDGRPRVGVLRHPELRQRSFAVSSFGKAYHNTGWKVGWVTAPAPLTQEVRKVHQFIAFSTNTPAQWALAQTLSDEPEHLERLAGFYAAKRDKFRSLLRKTPFELLDVAGTYFQLAEYGQLSTAPDFEFAQELTRRAKVAVIPVSSFYSLPPRRNLVRFCFAKTDGALEEAAQRLTRFAASL
jgi:methionine aminotransferase